jgi:TRAP-type C4-dicarboxylate transport system permease small subunit
MKALALLTRLERVFLVTVFLTMVVLFFFAVVIREVGGTLASDFAWIEEAVRLMNLFLVFGAIGLALERGRHVGVSTLRDLLPDRLRVPLLKAIDFLGFTFCLYLAWLGWQMVTFVLGTGQRSPTLDIPMGYIYLAPTAGFALLALRYGLSFAGAIDRFATPRDDGGKPAAPEAGA